MDANLIVVQHGEVVEQSGPVLVAASGTDATLRFLNLG